MTVIKTEDVTTAKQSQFFSSSSIRMHVRDRVHLYISLPNGNSRRLPFIIIETRASCLIIGAAASAVLSHNGDKFTDPSLRFMIPTFIEDPEEWESGRLLET